MNAADDTREFELQERDASAEPFLRQSIKGLRAGEFFFDVGRSWGVLWRMFFRLAIVGALAAGLIGTLAFFWRLVSGSEFNPFDSPITHFLIAAVIAYLLLRCSLVLPITIVEGHSAKMSMKRSRQLTSPRRSKATIWLCLVAYTPIVALLFIGSQTDISAQVGTVAMLFILTTAVFVSSLMATGCNRIPGKPRQ